MSNNSLSWKSKWWIAAFIVVVAAIGIWALQHPKHLDLSPRSESQLRDVLLLAQTQISSFDPLDAFHEGHIQVVKQIYETLTDVDEQGKCVPLLADKWETTDNRVWRFHLKNNAYFASAPAFANEAERHLEAADVVYSFERLLGPESKSLGVAYFSNIAGLDEFRAGKEATLRGVRALSNDVVEFELTKPDAGFYCVVSVPFASIVKQKAVTYFGADFKLKPTGTGPFVLAAYEPDQQIILYRNPEFRRGPGEPLIPTVAEVRIQLTRDENAAYAAFASGASNFLVLDFAGLTRTRREKGFPVFEIVSRPTAKLQLYLFNLKTVGNPAIRQNIKCGSESAKASGTAG